MLYPIVNHQCYFHTSGNYKFLVNITNMGSYFDGTERYDLKKGKRKGEWSSKNRD